MLCQFSDLHSIMISQVVREFKCPDGLTDREVDAAGDGRNLKCNSFLILYVIGA